MIVSVNLYSQKSEELNRFLSSFYNTNFDIKDLNWEKKYTNPIELAEIVGVFIDNYNDYVLNMWISLDNNIFVHVTEENADAIIKYLYERYPY